MTVWKPRHVLCTTELYWNFLNPVVADCTCSTVLVFLVVRVKVKLCLCRAGIKGDWRYSCKHYSRLGEWSALRLGRFTPRGKSFRWPSNKKQNGLRAGLDVGEKTEIGSSRLVFKNMYMPYSYMTYAWFVLFQRCASHRTMHISYRSKTYTWNDVILVKRSMIRVFV